MAINNFKDLGTRARPTSTDRLRTLRALDMIEQICEICASQGGEFYLGTDNDDPISSEDLRRIPNILRKALQA